MRRSPACMAITCMALACVTLGCGSERSLDPVRLRDQRMNDPKAPYGQEGPFDLERMIDQARFDPYEPSPYFPGGTIMQPPPPGTVSRSQELPPPATGEGLADGVAVARVPIPVTAALVERGRNRFEIFCAACHGIAGDGDSPVASVMKLRPPPSLVAPPIRTYPAGRVYRAISLGFGLMPSYAAELDIVDRWAVVAYVQALGLSQYAQLDDLPAELQKEALAWLK